MTELNIALVTSGLNFNGDTIKKQALGGSETALLCMGRELAALGHRVSVFCSCDQPGNYDGVDYYHHQNWQKVSLATRYDVLVVSRWMEFLTTPSYAGLRVLWCHDTIQDKARIWNQVWQCDQVMLLSDYHIANYTVGADDEETEKSKIAELLPWIWKTSNGIDMEQVTRNLRPKVPGKLIYTSRPERGLHYLLSGVLPRLLKDFPEIKLHFANYPLQNLQVPQQIQQVIELSMNLAKKYPKNVVPMGHLSKDELYQEISSAELLVYPTSFPEISPVRGDTKIETLGGRTAIKDLVGKKDFRVYSCDEGGNLSISAVKGVFQTRKNAKMLRLRVRPGRGRNAKKEKSLFLTPDHEVMLVDGTYTRADSLKPGDRLKAFRRQKNDWGKGYDSIGLTGTQTTPEHRFVAERKLGRALKKGETVDHDDSNTYNNTFENLKVWGSHSEHMKSHYERMPDEEKEKRTGYLMDLHASMTDEELSATKRRIANDAWKARKAGNHIVVAIEMTENADAYCMEVEPDHNFVANGLVVHNCITAMEAQACGTPIVSTNDFALKETVANGHTGYLVNGKPEDGDEYFDKFARKVKLLLKDSPLCSTMSEAGPKWIMEQGFTWAQVAKSWEARFISLMEDRFHANSIPVIRELQRNHDLVMASQLALDLPRDETRQELVEELSECLESAVIPELPTSGEQIKEMTKASTPRFNKMIQLMLVSKCDPKVIWDFACGDASFGLAMAASSSKVESWCCDADEQVLQRINSYAAKVEEKRETGVDKRVHTIQVSSLENAEELAAKPDLIFLGGYLDSVTEPWLEIEKATKIVGPGGWVAITTRFGASTAVIPGVEEHRRIWSFTQEDYYEMFGREFKGALTIHTDGISPGGDPQGHWLALVPVPEEPFVCQPLLPDLRRRTTRPYQTIAACMIMRDSEDWVGLCLKRVLPLVDKVVVVLDDRTDDNTLQVLSWLDPGGKIEIRSLQFSDFSQMRNASKHDVESDWIFWIDTDEMLVDGAKLRRYTNSTFFNGFSIRQNHLMLDVHGTFDIPVRLLRNKENYRFVGCIHEHCMDVSNGDFDTSIKPSMLIPDVDLAHYGYLSEKQRRLKCSNRNMELLKKDIEIYGKKGRKLTWILVIRDYLNIIKWQAEKKELKGGIGRGSEEHALLEAAIATYHEHFRDPKSRFHALAFPMYQEALQILGKSGVPVGDRKAPPFSIALGLAASMGGDANDNVKAKIAWFLDEIECLEFMEKQNKMMLQKLGVVGQKQYAADLERPSEVEVEYSEDLSNLLETGIHAIHQDTGKLR